LKLLETYPKESSWCEETDCITPSRPQYFYKKKNLNPCYLFNYTYYGKLFVYIVLYQIRYDPDFVHRAWNHEKVYKSNDSSS